MPMPFLPRQFEANSKKQRSWLLLCLAAFTLPVSFAVFPLVGGQGATLGAQNRMGKDSDTGELGRQAKPAADQVSAQDIKKLIADLGDDSFKGARKSNEGA